MNKPVIVRFPNKKTHMYNYGVATGLVWVSRRGKETERELCCLIGKRSEEFPEDMCMATVPVSLERMNMLLAPGSEILDEEAVRRIMREDKKAESFICKLKDAFPMR